MRNADPSLVVKHGFVELPELLGGPLCGALSRVSMDKAHAISNARELDCQSLEEQWAAVKYAVEDNAVVRQAIECAFGVAEFCLEEAKLLEADGDEPPQIPHADAINNAGGMFGVVQLRGGQAPTEAVEYAGVEDLFVEEETECAECESPIQLTDKQARQRDHLRLSDLGAVVPWTCARAGRGECGRRRKKSRRQEAQRTDNFLGVRVCNAFRSLLEDPAGVIKRMQPCGEPAPDVGDALLALPTLLHRGPGGGGGAVARRVLFFFVRPIFAPARYLDGGVAFRYDPSSQVHAAYLLELAAKCAPSGFLAEVEAQLVRKRYAEDLQPRGIYDLRRFQPTRGLRAGVGEPN